MSTGAMFGRNDYPAQDAEAVRQNWGWFLALGIAMIALGTIAIFAAIAATLASVMIFGVLLLVAGIIQAVQAFGARRGSGVALHVLFALLYLAVGGILVADPVGGAIGLTLVLGVFLLAAGVFRVVMAAQIRQGRSWGWLLFSGLLSLLLGILILAGWPSTGFWVIGLFVGIEFLFSGWAIVMVSLAGRRAAAPAP